MATAAPPRVPSTLPRHAPASRPAQPPATTTTEAGWGFVAWFGAVAFVLIAGIAAVNSYVDPLGLFGRERFAPVSQVAYDRTVKLEVLRAHPDATHVVLGSSRAKLWDPQQLAPDGDGVNAAVTGGDVLDALVYTRWLAERARTNGTPMPHVVYALDVESLRKSEVQPAIVREPELRAQLSLRLRANAVVTNQLAPLLRTDTTAASARVLWSEARGGWPAANIDAVRSAHRDDGYNESDARFFRTAWATDRAELRARFRQSVAQYSGFYRRHRGLNEGAVAQLGQLVATANHAGDTPSIVLTPMHPQLARTLAGLDRAARHRQLLDELARMSRRHDLRVLDYTRLLPADPQLWIDGVHPSPAGDRMIVERLRRDAPLVGAGRRNAHTRL